MQDLKVAARTPLQLIGKKKIGILRTPSQNVVSVNSELMRLAGRMLGTVRKTNGIAIAAVQVGYPINLVVLATGDSFINVKVEGFGEPLVEDWEGCLSLPGKRYKIPRFPEVDFEAQTLFGGEVSNHFEGFEARMWQHEYDHILGKLLSDDYKDSRGR